MEYETAALWEAGLLDEKEVAEAEASWREHFKRAHEPSFQYCIGHAKPGDTFATWIKGAEARRAHYRWAGIPKALIRKWTKNARSDGVTVEGR
jgi:hypothetical protein